MIKDVTSPQPRPISSAGSIVSAAVQIYRLHFREYLRLSIAAHRWLIVPFYGWAKFAELSALISKLTFDRFSHQTDEANNSHDALKSLKWKLLITNILAISIVILLGVISLIIGFVVLAVLLALLWFFAGILPPTNSSKGVHVIAMGVAVWALVFLAMLWSYSHLFIVELPLAVEEPTSPIRKLKRSVQLSKSQIFHILGVIIITFLLILPISLLLQFLRGRGIKLALIFLQGDAQTYNFAQDLSSLLLGLLISIICTPLWQAVKAVLYYDLLNRRESFGLRLRDR